MKNKAFIFSELIIVLFLLLNFHACKSGNNSIIGHWKLVQSTENKITTDFLNSKFKKGNCSQFKEEPDGFMFRDCIFKQNKFYWFLKDKKDSTSYYIKNNILIFPEKEFDDFNKIAIQTFVVKSDTLILNVFTKDKTTLLWKGILLRQE